MKDIKGIELKAALAKVKYFMEHLKSSHFSLPPLQPETWAAHSKNVRGPRYCLNSSATFLSLAICGSESPVLVLLPAHVLED